MMRKFLRSRKISFFPVHYKLTVKVYDEFNCSCTYTGIYIVEEISLTASKTDYIFHIQKC